MRLHLRLMAVQECVSVVGAFAATHGAGRRGGRGRRKRRELWTRHHNSVITIVHAWQVSMVQLCDRDALRVRLRWRQTP